MRNTLVKGLMKYYEKFGFIKPLPWGEPIPIDALYTTCQCTVTNVKGDVSNHASDFLSAPEFNFDNNRVFIIADLGYGKTTYTQHLVSDWVSKMKPTKTDKKNTIRETILIYVHLKEVDPSMILSELVKEMMPAGIDLTVDDIAEIFMNFEFQVLFDGLDELSMSTISTNTSPENLTNDKEERVNLLQEEVENDSNLTVGKLLDNKINTVKFKKIKVWVTSREVDDMQASFGLPYSKKVNNQSIQEDIKSLEASLGKIAFENKMSLSLGKREYWNNKLGEKDTQLALAVGLLKYSKKVGSGGSQLEELAFSSYAGIMFYHEFFQEFLAAQYVPEGDKEWAWIDELITKSTDDATVRLLQFMFGMNHARLDKAVKSLLKEKKMWNNFITCIIEVVDPERKKSIIENMNKGLGNMNINILHLDRKQHEIALKEFCNTCNALGVKLTRMTFKEDCASNFIKDVALPSLNVLIFLEMNINEDQFVSIITSLTNRKCPENLQFVKCSVPDNLKGEAKEKVESALRGLKMKSE
ncbi:hypothetical protein BSL78_02749 [Apostichopus japonicus]|uniref:NACHT domain-containing protein n=1 Tax=Stichopus japonicus TaxID=307972 RepID=A0A2G8LJ88_STIJA|nr:hypothetical protein BSL78_02749 [Apostichopus japonicus]